MRLVFSKKIFIAVVVLLLAFAFCACDGSNEEISATANYGYQFSQWNDGNTENPRVVQATEDKTYTAYFCEDTAYDFGPVRHRRTAEFLPVTFSFPFYQVLRIQIPPQ